MRLACLFALLLALSAPGAVPPTDAIGLKLVWCDEFNQPDGSAPDPAKWGHDIGGNGWGNNEREFCTARTGNARIENGQLVIEARKEDYGGRTRWFMDGRQYFQVTPANLPAGARWVFNAPKFLLLNLAVGGYWPGYPDATTVFPQRMIVDYVRVYRKSLSAEDPVSIPSQTSNQ